MYYLHTILSDAIFTAKRKKFSMKDFFSKYDQIHRKLRIWSHLLKKPLMEDVIFCVVFLERHIISSVEDSR